MGIRETGRIVYSTEGGEGTCPRCGKGVTGCTCGKKGGSERHVGSVPNDGVVRIRREVKGRRGKGVTTISGLPLAGQELRALAGELKRKCGSGGSVKEGVIEIQGDHRDLLLADLGARGYRVKKAGG